MRSRARTTPPTRPSASPTVLGRATASRPAAGRRATPPALPSASATVPGAATASRPARRVRPAWQGPPARQDQPARQDGPPRQDGPARRARRLAGAGLAATAGLALAVGAPLAASAHVELDASSTVPATISVLTFAVGHGCEGSATTSLAIEFPASVQAVTPTVKPGWQVTRATASGDAASAASGTAGTSAGGATTVTWTADDPLPDGFRDTVQVQALLPVDGAAGDVVTFPTVQTCEQGSYDWVEPATGDGAEPASPAPALVLTDGGTAAAGATDELDVVASSADPATAAPVDRTARLLGTGALVVGGVAVVLLTAVLRRASGDGRRAGGPAGSDR